MTAQENLKAYLEIYKGIEKQTAHQDIVFGELSEAEKLYDAATTQSLTKYAMSELVEEAIEVSELVLSSEWNFDKLSATLEVVSALLRKERHEKLNRLSDRLWDMRYPDVDDYGGGLSVEDLGGWYEDGVLMGLSDSERELFE